MIAEKMADLVKNSSIIRAMFEEGKKMSEQYGSDNVYDFSLGNPSVEPPKQVKEIMIDILKKENPNLLHGYMNNSGYEDVRSTIAEFLNQRFHTAFNYEDILMTVGAAGGLNVILKTLLNPKDEVIVFAPFFGEYRNYVSNFDANLVIVSPNIPSFLPDLKEFEQKITNKTKAVIINTPNNPTGVVYSENTIKALAQILREKQKEFHTSIYLISDEPYRELVYDKIEVPYLTKYYDNTIVGYSYSKSLSLPGERIGYLVMPKTLDDYKNIVTAANVANRILGFVNAPSLLQRTVAKCLSFQVDIESYNKNRELLYHKLTEYGYECIKPQGAFYLFVKSLEPDDIKFSKKAKQHHLLVVPGTSFACSGYIRIAYCVDYEMIVRSLPAFLELAKEYKEMA